MAKTTVLVRLLTYDGDSRTPNGHVMAPVEADVVGDLAVHRRCTLGEDGVTPAFTEKWTVTHVPTGDAVRGAFPESFWGVAGIVVASRATLMAWAKAFQAAAPDYFAAVRDGDTSAVTEPMTNDARAIGRALTIKGETPKTASV